jgi:hypothetical protein
MRLEVHSEARAEFLEAVSFYDARVPGLGARFIDIPDQMSLASQSRFDLPFER